MRQVSSAQSSTSFKLLNRLFDKDKEHVRQNVATAVSACFASRDEKAASTLQIFACFVQKQLFVIHVMPELITQHCY